MIEKLRNAVEEMKRITGLDYATAEVHCGSDHTISYQVYTQLTLCIVGKTLDEVLQIAKEKCGPESLIKKANELRKQAYNFEAEAKRLRMQADNTCPQCEFANGTD